MQLSALESLTVDDDGRRLVPAGNDWDEWVAAGATRSFCEGDPLLDWFERYGERRGFMPDAQRPGYQANLNFTDFVEAKGNEFEAAVVAWLEQRFPIKRISYGPPDTRSLALAEETVRAMQNGEPIIHQAVLRNPANRTYGICDLLVRSDILAQLYPTTLSPQEAARPAPAFTHGWHYRAIEIKFTTIDLLKDNNLAAGMRSYAVQVWIYNEALGRLQGFMPDASYILGRGWKSAAARVQRCDDRLGIVTHVGRVGTRGPLLSETVTAVIEWHRRLATVGSQWQLLPEPSVSELWPNMKFIEDHPWHSAKKQLAEELAELTLLPAVSSDKRMKAHEAGIRRWDQPGLRAAQLGVTGPAFSLRLDAVLNANRRDNVLAHGESPVWPERIELADDTWRTPAKAEFYVDFETVSNLDDDFSQLPLAGGQALIFQIGCGMWREGEWQFAQWTTDSLCEADETSIIAKWLAHMQAQLKEAGIGWSDARIVHWSAAETSTLLNAYNSATNRHPGEQWPQLPWFDFLEHVVRAAPVTVRGAFGFGLKAIAKAMHGHGLLETSWADGPADGLGAMVGAWAAHKEAMSRGLSMMELPLMQEIAAYNQVDCRAMAEIVAWLRANR